MALHHLRHLYHTLIPFPFLVHRSQWRQEMREPTTAGHTLTCQVLREATCYCRPAQPAETPTTRNFAIEIELGEALNSLLAEAAMAGVGLDARNRRDLERILAASRPPWTVEQHRKDAKLVQAAMQRIAERRLDFGATHRQPSVYVPIEDASDLLMAMHHDGIYRPDAKPVPDVDQLAEAIDKAWRREGSDHSAFGPGLADEGRVLARLIAAEWDVSGEDK